MNALVDDSPKPRDRQTHAVVAFFLNSTGYRVGENYWVNSPNPRDLLLALNNSGIHVVLCIPVKAAVEVPPRTWPIPTEIEVFELPFYSANLELITHAPILLARGLLRIRGRLQDWDWVGGAGPSVFGLFLILSAIVGGRKPFMFVRGNTMASLRAEYRQKPRWQSSLVLCCFSLLDRAGKFLTKRGMLTFTLGPDLLRFFTGPAVVPIAAYARSGIVVDDPIPPLSPDDLHHLAFVGRLSNEKGADVLFEAIALLVARDCPVTLVLAGDGPERERLEALAASLHISDRVDFRGHVMDMAELRDVYAGAGIVVLSSRTEGVPFSMLEGMSLGRVVIASNVGGIPSILKDEKNGLLIPSEDPLQLADAIVRVQLDLPLARKLAQAGRETAALHTPEAQAERMAAAFLSRRKDFSFHRQ